jgi:Glycosyl transferases group 1
MFDTNKPTVGPIESAWLRSRQAMGTFRDSTIGKKYRPWSKETPTTSIYFSDVMSDLIGENTASKKPILRIEPNVFMTVGQNPKILVVRYISPDGLLKIQRRSVKDVIYLVDDDISSIELESKLPKDYRRRMIKFKNEIVLPISKIASEIIAPSPLIVDKFRKKSKTILMPSFIHEPADLTHHDNLGEQFNIVFNGTRSHLADFNFIVPAIKNILSRNPHVRVTTFLGDYAPSGLQGSQVSHLSAMDWNSYRRFVGANKFHVALAPALDTQFNRARSPSRILDNAGYGAVGIYSDRQPFSDWIVHNDNGLLVADEPNSWVAAIEDLLNNRSKSKAIAENGKQCALQLGDRNRMRQFWLDKLAISL